MCSLEEVVSALINDASACTSNASSTVASLLNCNGTEKDVSIEHIEPLVLALCGHAKSPVILEVLLTLHAYAPHLDIPSKIKHLGPSLKVPETNLASFLDAFSSSGSASQCPFLASYFCEVALSTISEDRRDRTLVAPIVYQLLRCSSYTASTSCTKMLVPCVLSLLADGGTDVLFHIELFSKQSLVFKNELVAFLGQQLKKKSAVEKSADVLRPKVLSLLFRLEAVAAFAVSDILDAISSDVEPSVPFAEFCVDHLTAETYEKLHPVLFSMMMNFASGSQHQFYSFLDFFVQRCLPNSPTTVLRCVPFIRMLSSFPPSTAIATRLWDFLTALLPLSMSSFPLSADISIYGVFLGKCVQRHGIDASIPCLKWMASAADALRLLSGSVGISIREAAVTCRIVSLRRHRRCIIQGILLSKNFETRHSSEDELWFSKVLVDHSIKLETMEDVHLALSAGDTTQIESTIDEFIGKVSQISDDGEESAVQSTVMFVLSLLWASATLLSEDGTEQGKESTIERLTHMWALLKMFKITMEKKQKKSQKMTTKKNPLGVCPVPSACSIHNTILLLTDYPDHELAVDDEFHRLLSETYIVSHRIYRFDVDFRIILTEIKSHHSSNLLPFILTLYAENCAQPSSVIQTVPTVASASSSSSTAAELAVSGCSVDIIPLLNEILLDFRYPLTSEAQIRIVEDVATEFGAADVIYSKVLPGMLANCASLNQYVARLKDHDRKVSLQKAAMLLKLPIPGFFRSLLTNSVSSFGIDSRMEQNFGELVFEAPEFDVKIASGREDRETVLKLLTTHLVDQMGSKGITTQDISSVAILLMSDTGAGMGSVWGSVISLYMCASQCIRKHTLDVQLAQEVIQEVSARVYVRLNSSYKRPQKGETAFLPKVVWAVEQFEGALLKERRQYEDALSVLKRPTSRDLRVDWEEVVTQLRKNATDSEKNDDEEEGDETDETDEADEADEADENENEELEAEGSESESSVVANTRAQSEKAHPAKRRRHG
eukprot:ANDGO_03930.mRNA.1 hypothetical protein